MSKGCPCYGPRSPGGGKLSAALCNVMTGDEALGGSLLPVSPLKKGSVKNHNGEKRGEPWRCPADAKFKNEPIRAAADPGPRKLVGSLAGVVPVPFCASASRAVKASNAKRNTFRMRLVRWGIRWQPEADAMIFVFFLGRFQI